MLLNFYYNKKTGIGKDFFIKLVDKNGLILYSNHDGGAGLGLYLSKILVEMQAERYGLKANRKKEVNLYL